MFFTMHFNGPFEKETEKWTFTKKIQVFSYFINFNYFIYII